MTTHSSQALVRGTSIVGSLTLLSRVLGFVREILIARLFGASVAADAYFVALRIPNLLRSIFAEGALTSAFVPVFARELTGGSKKAQEAFSAILTLLLIVTTIITLVGIAWADVIIDLIAPGFIATPERRALCIQLTQIMFPYIICVSFIALLNGALNSLRIFGASAWAQVVMNCVLIVGAYSAGWFEYYTAAVTLAWSVLIGGIVQVASQIPALQRAGLRFQLSSSVLTNPTRAVMRLMLPAIFGAAVYQLTIFLNTQLASLLAPGSVSWLSYADRLTQLPIGVFTIALSSVLLPTLARANAENNSKDFSQSLNNSLRFTSFFIFPISIALYLFAEPLISLMFERGQFDTRATTQTARAVQMYSVGLWAVSVHSMLIRAFNAQHDTKTPTMLGILTLLVTLLLSLMFMGEAAHPPVGSIENLLLSTQAQLVSFFGQYSLGHAGLALAGSCAFYITATFALIILSLRTATSFAPFLLSSLQSLVASFGAGYLITRVAPIHAIQLLELLWRIPLYCLIYFFASLLINSREAKETFALIVRILRRDTRNSKSS